MDTPVSITAFTAAEIQVRQISNAADIDVNVAYTLVAEPVSEVVRDVT